jgi:hypothetical protein
LASLEGCGSPASGRTRAALRQLTDFGPIRAYQRFLLRATPALELAFGGNSVCYPIEVL